ncbi:MAG: hypothetical protein VYE68_15525 [Acidobacteriota bacterium]|nr:hypothetical protein [Acidobacteriota bacterium]
MLLLLSGDSEPAVATLAEATLARIPLEALRAFLARSEVPKDVRDASAARGVTPGPVPATDDAAPPVEVATRDDATLRYNESRPQVLAGLPVIDRIKMV